MSLHAESRQVFDLFGLKSTMRKQAKPEALLDHYLGAIGLWRKPIPRDGFSLFRAVSEQLFWTQIHYYTLYQACRLFFSLNDKDPETDWHVGELMQILSRMYKRDFLIYELNADHSPVPATNNGYEKKILLCRVDSNHLDSVYPAAFVQNAAVCQSIIYEILYRSVFRLDQELSEAVDLLRDQNKHKRSRLDSFITQTYDITGLGEEQLQRLRDLHITKERHLQRVTPPLPYRIAKALDPDIYRNVELDIWEEERRELSREANLCKETKFSPGDKCQVFDNGCVYHGHIQELTENEGPVLVFIEELGQKRTVPYQSLKPVPAKNNSQLVFYKNYRRRKDMPVSSPMTAAVSKSYTPNMQVTNYQQMAPPVSHQQLQQTDNSYKVNLFTNLYQGHPPGVRSFHMNNMQQVNSMDQAALSSQYPSSPTHQGPQNFSAPPLQHLMQYTSNIGSPIAMYPGYQPSVPIPPPMYTCICVPYLETIQLAQVNLNSQPSQDSMGKDLPHTDMNTLRFFYNLGIEHYRTLMTQSSMWPSSVDLQQITPDQMNGNICSGQFPQNFYQNCMQVNPSHKTTVNTDTTPSSTFSASASALSCSANDHLESNSLSSQLGSKSKVEEQSPSGGSGHSHSSEGDDPTVGGDLCHDSGCDSDSMTCSASLHSDDSFKEEVEAEKSGCEPNGAHEENEKSESCLVSESLIAREEDSESACESLSLAGDVVNQAVELETSQEQMNQRKPTTRKKYYMYGNHKLVKPIKDIPPRFLSMLAETSAARARCEGEPIIIPFLPPKPNAMHHYHHQMISGTVTNSFQPVTKFNPEAQCFIPSSTPSTSLSSGNSNANVTSPIIHNGNGSDTMTASLASAYSAVPAFSPMAEVPQPNSSMPTNSYCTVYMYDSSFNYNQTGCGVSKVEGNCIGVEACKSFYTQSSSCSNASSGGGAYNVSCTPSHSTGTASQVTACSMSNYPTAACPPAAFYYTNQTFPTGAPQPCLPAPHGVTSGPGIAYFSGAQPFSLPPPPQVAVSQMQSPAQASH